MTVKVRIIKSNIEMYISEKDVLRIFYHTHIGKSKYTKVNSTTENFDFTPSELSLIHI